VRIGGDGAVTDGCFPSDDIGDPAFRACVLEAARATRFPVPDPPGHVDVVVPLAFAPSDSMRQAALCE
jgi:hypothetical protein